MTDKRIKEPCPFCGCKPTKITVKTHQGGMTRVQCPICHATFEGLGDKRIMIDRWNNRISNYPRKM